MTRRTLNSEFKGLLDFDSSSLCLWVVFRFQRLEKLFHMITDFKGAVMLKDDVGHILQGKSESDFSFYETLGTVQSCLSLLDGPVVSQDTKVDPGVLEIIA